MATEAGLAGIELMQWNKVNPRVQSVIDNWEKHEKGMKAAIEHCKQ